MREIQTRPPEAPSEYYYRRDLAARDLLPAIGAGIGIGLVAFYVARLFLERTPLSVPRLGRMAEGARAQRRRAQLIDPAAERPARLAPRALSAEGAPQSGGPQGGGDRGYVLDKDEVGLRQVESRQSGPSGAGKLGG